MRCLFCFDSMLAQPSQRLAFTAPCCCRTCSVLQQHLLAYEVLTAAQHASAQVDAAAPDVLVLKTLFKAGRPSLRDALNKWLDAAGEVEDSGDQDAVGLRSRVKRSVLWKFFKRACGEVPAGFKCECCGELAEGDVHHVIHPGALGAFRSGYKCKRQLHQDWIKPLDPAQVAADGESVSPYALRCAWPWWKIGICSYCFPFPVIYHFICL